jgi:uncharacterized damage-inducible protein DinB
MPYPFAAIAEAAIPTAREPLLQHLLDIYASETNKTVSIWRRFDDDLLDWRPHPKSGTVREVIRHQLLSERRFFGEFLGTPEPPPADVLPDPLTVESGCHRVAGLALARLGFFAAQESGWWTEEAPFFGERRQRIWIFWRRVLHSAHHRTQLTVYLRLLERRVPSTYGPTADETWDGADPTNTVEAAGRK